MGQAVTLAKPGPGVQPVAFCAPCLDEYNVKMAQFNAEVAGWRKHGFWWRFFHSGPYGPPPPRGAVVMINGTGLCQWHHAKRMGALD
jgi:hypothetical protein